MIIIIFYLRSFTHRCFVRFTLDFNITAIEKHFCKILKRIASTHPAGKYEPPYDSKTNAIQHLFQWINLVWTKNSFKVQRSNWIACLNSCQAIVLVSVRTALDQKVKWNIESHLIILFSFIQFEFLRCRNIFNFFYRMARRQNGQPMVKHSLSCGVTKKKEEKNPFEKMAFLVI